MSRIPGMPFLPGTVFRDITKTNFPKTQSLTNVRGISMLADRQLPTLVDPHGTIADPNCPPIEMPSMYPPKEGPKLPAWLAYDKQVLLFHAYFKETLQEVYNAPYQVRKVKLYYYLEDGTIMVTEPRIKNSGIPQGCLVHRQRVPLPAPNQNEFISILDLNVDQTITIFDRVYHITGCDKFTKHFLNRAGITVPDPVENPLDPTAEIRKRADLKVKTPSVKKHSFAQFLEFDRKVLKFNGYWDDRSEYGDIRNLQISYYLADDTMDIKEVFPANSGRDGGGPFLKRCKLPREWNGLPLPGQEAPLTILNVLGGIGAPVRYMEDILQTGAKDSPYYTDRDLQIGTELNVFGRSVMLTDCDSFTKDYYSKKYGIEDFKPIPIPIRFEERIPQKLRERELPPYNGWGSYEDSEGNCLSVEPKPPQADFKKFVQFDRFILRFGAKLLSTIRENCERIFIISYYLADDTIQIYETAVRNSGFLGGEFAKRIRIPLPNQDKFSSKRPIYYQPHNMYIGATVNLKDHIFHIVSADEYTLLYMENHPFEFPLADVKTIMKKIGNAAQLNYKEFVNKCLPDIVSEQEVKFVNYQTMKRALIELLGDEITDHEIITICRYFSAEQTPPQTCNRENVRAVAHLEMRRNLWNSLEQLKEHIHHVNPMKKLFLPHVKIRSTLKGCRLPFSDELIEDILMVLNHNDCGEVEVCDLLSFLDMGCNPAPDIPPVNIAFELCPKLPFLHKGRLVNWNCFLEYLGLEKELQKEAD